MVNEFLASLVDAVNVAVNVHAVTVGPVIWLVNVEFIKAFSDFDFVNVFGNVDHLSRVLHETAVLTFGSFVRAESAPLGRVQISCFEVRLASHKRGGDTPHVRKGCKVGGAVKQLADTGAATDPVSCGQGVHDFAGEDVRPKTRRDFEFPLSVVVALKLVLEVSSELAGRDSEEVFDEVARKADSLVGVVVLVAGVSTFNRHFENLAHDSAEVDGFLLSVFGLVAKVREQLAVKQLVDTCFTVFLLLTCGEFLFQPLMAFFGGDDLVFFVVVYFVDVGNDVLERVRVPCNGLEDVLVVFNTESSHQQHNGNGRGSSGADLDHQHTISALFDGEWLSHTVFLGEDFGHFCLLGVALVDFDRNSVRSKVFH